MEFRSLAADAPDYDPDRVVAAPFLDGAQSNVRVIRISPGQTLVPHRHGSSDLMLFAVEGDGMLDNEATQVALPAGSLVYIRPDEELRISNAGSVGLTLMAFLAPPFPPRAEA